MINLNDISQKLSANVLSFAEQQALKGKGRCGGRNRCGGGGRRRRRRNGGGGCSSSSGTTVTTEETSTPIKNDASTDLGGGAWDLG